MHTSIEDALLRVDGDDFDFVDGIGDVVSPKRETDLDVGDAGLGLEIGLGCWWCGTSDRLPPLAELLFGQGVAPEAVD